MTTYLVGTWWVNHYFNIGTCWKYKFLFLATFIHTSGKKLLSVLNISSYSTYTFFQLRDIYVSSVFQRLYKKQQEDKIHQWSTWPVPLWSYQLRSLAIFNWNSFCFVRFWKVETMNDTCEDSDQYRGPASWINIFPLPLSLQFSCMFFRTNLHYRLFRRFWKWFQSSVYPASSTQTWVPSMIPSARPSVPLAPITMLTKKFIFCKIFKSEDRRTYTHHLWK